MNSLARKLDILHHPLMYSCHADCHAPSEMRANDTMEIACLEPSNPIVRGDARFKRLILKHVNQYCIYSQTYK